MSIQSIFIFILLIFGVFLMADLSPRKITDAVISWLSHDRQDIRSVIHRANNFKQYRRNPLNIIRKNLMDARSVLINSGREALFSTLILISIVFFIGGFLFGMFINNMPLSLVLSVGFGLLPFWYIKMTEINFLKELNEELETALSVVSTSYTRSGNFKKAVEENLYLLNPPISDVFEKFIFEISYVSSDMERAIFHMSEKINNTIFQEWCRMIMACQDNPNLIPALSGIVDKLADVKQKTSDLAVKLFVPLRDNSMLIMIYLGVFPLFYLIHREWFNNLVSTDAGKIITACGCAIVFFVLNKSVDQTRPIEYKV